MKQQQTMLIIAIAERQGQSAVAGWLPEVRLAAAGDRRKSHIGKPALRRSDIPQFIVLQAQIAATAIEFDASTVVAQTPNLIKTVQGQRRTVLPRQQSRRRIGGLQVQSLVLRQRERLQTGIPAQMAGALFEIGLAFQ